MATISAPRLAFTGLYLLLWPGLVFLLAGDLRWVEGWLFGVWFVVLCATCIVWLYRKDPALLAERYRAPGTGGQSRADTLMVYALAAGFAVWISVPPLDARRFGWTHLPGGLRGLGIALLLGSAFFLFRSFTDNTYLSPLVRVQTERKQQVVTTGVYRFVRHPMYLGATLMFFGAPLLLGSGLGLIPALGLTLLLTTRIRGEERVLTHQLEGYADYRQRVRFRLLPYVW